MTFRVRLATPPDLPGAAELAGRLVRAHHAIDERRFFLPANVEAGYAWWFEKELANEAARILVATRPSEPRVLGYAYGRREDRNYNALLDVHGYVHDLFVVDDARREGVGEALLRCLLAELRALGVPQVLLMTATGNAAAQRLFERVGFRATMLEMALG